MFREQPEPVHHDIDLGAGVEPAGILLIVEMQNPAGARLEDPDKPQSQQAFAEGPAGYFFRAGRGEQDGRLTPWIFLEQLIGDRFRGVRAHLASAARAESRAGAGIDQAQVIVNLGDRSDRAARRVHRVALLDGHRRAQPLDLVHIRPRDALHELEHISRQGLQEPAAALLVNRIEKERALA